MVDTSNYYLGKLDKFVVEKCEPILEEPIARKLSKVAKTYMGAFGKQVENLDIDRYHYILLLIAEQPGLLTQKRLTEITGKDKSAMVSIIDSLTSDGYVYREINPADRREQLIKITDKTRKDILCIKKSYEVLNNKAAEGITADKLNTFNEVLHLMDANLQTLIKPTGLRATPKK